MQVLSYSDRPNYSRALRALNEASPIYYDMKRMSDEFVMARKVIDMKFKQLNILRDIAIDKKIRELNGSLGTISVMEEAQTHSMISNLKKVKLKPFNPNSPKQIATILFDAYDIPSSNFILKGKVSTAGDLLEEYYSKTKHEFIGALLEYREHVSTLRGLTDILSHAAKTDLVSNTGNAMIEVKPTWGSTVSSRFTTSNPNIQGLKKSVKAFNCAREGYKLLSIDIKQQEVVIYFNTVVKEPNILRAFKRDSKDYYMTIAKFCIARDCLLKTLSKYCTSYDNDEESLLKANRTKLLRNVRHKSLDNNSISLEHKIGRFELEYKVNPEALYDYTDRILVLAPGLKSKDKALIERINNKLDQWGDDVLTEAVYMFANTDVDSTKRADYKQAILMTMYGASLAALSTEIDPLVAESLQDMIKSSKAYIDKEKEAKVCIKSKKLIVSSAFGTLSTIEDRTYGYKLRCLFNRPAQTTGADLTAFMITAFEDWKAKRGYTDDIVALTYSVYDEVNFHIRNDMLHLESEIKAFTEFQIEDWSPIYSESFIGDYNNGD